MGDILVGISLAVAILALLAWLIYDNMAERRFFKDLGDCGPDAKWRKYGNQSGPSL